MDLLLDWSILVISAVSTFQLCRRARDRSSEQD